MFTESHPWLPKSTRHEHTYPIPTDEKITAATNFDAFFHVDDVDVGHPTPCSSSNLDVFKKPQSTGRSGAAYMAAAGVSGGAASIPVGTAAAIYRCSL